MNKNKKRNNFDEIASSINKTSFSTNILDKLNKTSIPFDSKYYYSIVSLSKKLPLDALGRKMSGTAAKSPVFACNRRQVML